MFRRCMRSTSGHSAKEATEDDRRLGKKALGPYAFEERMPTSLITLLQTHDRNPQSQDAAEAGLQCIPLLAQLEAQDPQVATALLCHPSVRHIGKIKGEGNHFCGYRNIQMQLTYALETTAGVDALSNCGNHPSVIELQELIERAWDRGLNERGRVQTCGIRGTRKHIGTQEAQALFQSLGLACKARAFRDVRGGAKACDQLTDFVERHFMSHRADADQTSGRDAAGDSIKAVRTSAPPIYLQRPHHSMTVVGIEVRTDGTRSLLVFDPAFPPTQGVRCAAAADYAPVARPSGRLVEPYRRGRRQLNRYSAFETLNLVRGG